MSARKLKPGDRVRGLALPACLIRPLTDEEVRLRDRIKSGQHSNGRRWKMPPPALAAVLSAIKRGHVTFGKLRNSLGRKHSDAELRTAVQSLRGRGVITIDGRTYRAN